MILIVDDNQEFCINLKDLISRNPEYKVDMVFSFDDAYEYLKTEQYKVVICDVYLNTLTNKDGYALYNKCKQLMYNCEGINIPIHWIFISGEAGSSKKYQGLPNSNFISKSEDHHIILNSLSSVIREQTQQYSIQILNKALDTDTIVYAIESVLKSKNLNNEEDLDVIKNRLSDLYTLVEDKKKHIEDISSSLEMINSSLEELSKKKEDKYKDVEGWLVLGRFHKFMIDNRLYTVFLMMIIATVWGYMYIRKVPLLT